MAEREGYAPRSGDAGLTDGMRRRALERERPIDTTSAAIDPYAGNWLAETGRSHLQRTENWVPALEGLGRRMIGDDEGAQRAFEAHTEGEQRATERGSRVQSFDEAEGLGDYLHPGRGRRGRPHRRRRSGPPARTSAWPTAAPPRSCSTRTGPIPSIPGSRTCTPTWRA